MVAGRAKSVSRQSEANIVILNLPQRGWRQQRGIVVVAFVHDRGWKHVLVIGMSLQLARKLRDDSFAMGFDYPRLVRTLW